jgi:hypothetical protein
VASPAAAEAVRMASKGMWSGMRFLRVRPCKQYADIFICKVIFAAFCVTAAFPAWINPRGRLKAHGTSKHNPKDGMP